MKIGADDRGADVERLDQHVFDEDFRRPAGDRGVETQHHQAVEPRRLQRARLLGEGRQTENDWPAGKIVGRVRLEGQRRRGDVARARDPACRFDHRAMAEMHPVEIADRVDRATERRRRVGGIHDEREPGVGGVGDHSSFLRGPEASAASVSLARGTCPNASSGSRPSVQASGSEVAG